MWCVMSHSLPGDMRCPVTDLVLSLRPRDSRTEDARTLMASTINPAYHSVYLQHFLEEPLCDSHELVKMAWPLVVLNITRCWHNKSYGITSWSGVLQLLIEQGADVHQPSNALCSDSSAYLDILLMADSPIDADECANAWLRILESCGVSIGPYIERETQLIHSHWDVCPRNGCLRAKRLAMIQSERVLIPSWRWDYSPTDEPSALLKRFENLTCGDFSRGRCRPFISSPDDFKAWFESSVPDQVRWQYYPFRPTPLDYFEHSEDPVVCQTHRIAFKIREERLARREARRWRRSPHPRGALGTGRIPGSWVE